MLHVAGSSEADVFFLSVVSLREKAKGRAATIRRGCTSPEAQEAEHFCCVVAEESKKSYTASRERSCTSPEAREAELFGSFVMGNLNDMKDKEKSSSTI